MPDTSSQQYRKPGPHPLLLVLGYLLITLLPLLLAWLQDKPARSIRDELAAGLALTGFAMLLLEFVLSGRFRLTSRRIGIDLTMWFHQLMARVVVACILIHPYFYATPVSPRHPGDDSWLLSLGLDGASFASGMTAWLLLPVLVLLGIWRTRLPYRYETWRLTHATLAALIALLGLHHALGAGDFMSRVDDTPIGTTAWLDGPHGHFTLQGHSPPHIVFIAGGVGIAPSKGILRQLHAEHDPRPLQLNLWQPQRGTDRLWSRIRGHAAVPGSHRAPRAVRSATGLARPRRPAGKRPAV